MRALKDVISSMDSGLSDIPGTELSDKEEGGLS
jgi:hypothetical protein